MRFVTYERDGSVRHGRIDHTSGTIEELGDGDLLVLLEGPGLGADLPAVHTTRLDEVTLLAPIPRPPKLLATAANYASHVEGSGGIPVDPTAATPRLFMKPSSAVASHDSDVHIPYFSTFADWEVELAVVIGKRCRNVAKEDALDVVAGYMAANDVSTREYDFGFERNPRDIHGFFDWLEGKWADGFAPFGPWLVSADEVPDPDDLSLQMRVNGELVQDGSTGEMIFKTADLIAFASSFMTLEPGDVIETGTPGGTGVETGRRLAPGDVMVATVGHLGSVTTRVLAPLPR